MEFLQVFLHKCFIHVENRRAIIMHWHAQRKNTRERVAEGFQVFMETLLYGDLAFHLYPSYFVLFGPELPVYKRWFSQGEGAFERLQAQGAQLFVSAKVLPGGLFDYSQPKGMREADVITREVRRQLVRDFVWLVWSRQEWTLKQEIICALQWMLQKQRQRVDPFLTTLHFACQRGNERRVKEVICWDTNEWDLHEEIKKQRDK